MLVTLISCSSLKLWCQTISIQLNSLSLDILNHIFYIDVISLMHKAWRYTLDRACQSTVKINLSVNAMRCCASRYTANLTIFMSLLAIVTHPVMILYMIAFWNQCQPFSLLIPKPPLSFVETLMRTIRIGSYLALLIVMDAQLMNLVSLLAVIN